MLDLYINSPQTGGMKVKQSKAKKPTWATSNTVAIHMDRGVGMSEPRAKQRVKDNNRVAKILQQHGWKFREGINIAADCGNYYSLGFIKPIAGVSPPKNGIRLTYRHPYVHFSFRWENQGGEDFMVGEMYSFYNYAPTKSGMRPYAQFEVKYITEKHLALLDNLYDGVVAAINSQTRLYGDSNDIGG